MCSELDDLIFPPDPCEDCLTQDLRLSCTSNCSVPIEGSLGNNVVNIIGGVSDQETCDRQACKLKDCIG